MINYVKSWWARFRSWKPLSQRGEGYFAPARSGGALNNPDQALTLSAVYNAIRLYQTTLGSFPLVTYRRSDKGRERAREHPAYNLLHDRPNPAQSRSVFMELLARGLFCEGDFFAHVRTTTGGELVGLYPIPSCNVEQIYVDDEWRKAYLVRGANESEVYLDHEFIHLFLFSCDGIRGVPLLRYAAEALGLHKQVLESANAYYENAARPSGYIKYPGKLDDQAKANIKLGFKENLQGPKNTGAIPVLEMNGEWFPFSNTTAEDARIIEAMGASVGDVARWFGLSPLQLGDLERGTYSNLGADNTAFYQRSIRPLLDKIELEFNHKIFGPASDLYCEFLVDSILRADPEQQASIFQTGIQAGYYLRSEVRDWLNLPPIEGLDVPLFPLNMGPEMAEPDQAQPGAEGADVATEPAEPITPDQAQATASNDLRATVGGSAQVLAMQSSYANGDITREMAFANATIVFGFTTEEANQLFPELPPPEEEPQPVAGNQEQADQQPDQLPAEDGQQDALPSE